MAETNGRNAVRSWMVWYVVVLYYIGAHKTNRVARIRPNGRTWNGTEAKRIEQN